MAKFLDSNGLLYLWGKIKGLIPNKMSQLENDSGFITTSDIPEGAAASTTPPKMDGEVSIGTEKAFARGDHRHPSDTSRVPTTRKVNGKALSEDINLGASDVGARSDSWMPTASEVGARPSSWTPNAEDVGARPDTWMPTAAEVGARPSTWTPSAADVGAIPSSSKGTANGVCPLDKYSLVPNQYLPSYVDDVIEAFTISGASPLSAGWLSLASGGAALTPETGKIYVILSEGDYINKTYRWSGSTYVQTNPVDISIITNEEIDEVAAT